MAFSIAQSCNGKAWWALLASLAIWLAFPNDLWSLPPAALLWPVALLAIGIVSPTCKSAILTGWLASACGMEASLYWLCMPIAQVGGLPWGLAVLASLLVPAILAMQGGIFTAFVHAVRMRPYWGLIALASVAWYLLELAFAHVVGFPWLPLAGALAQWPVLIQFSAICGGYFTGGLWLFACLCVFAPFLDASGCSKWLPVLGCCLAALLLWHGACNLAEPERGDEVYALIVEGNIDQNQKWTPPFQKASLDTYIRITEQGVAQARLAHVQHPLLLWPETAMPFFFEENPVLSNQIIEAAQRWECPLLFGAPGLGRRGTDEEVYNRAFLLGANGQLLGFYDKMHLVPFGEYLPAWLRVEFLEALLQGVGIYQEGSSAESLHYGNLALGVLICYEAIFPWLARDRVTGGANILVDISNDGWFGRTPAARQHLYLTALRCVEQNRWLWRSTNTGISAVIDNRSRIIATGPQFQEGFMLWRAKLETERSIFYYLGVWLPWLACVVFTGLLVVGERRRICDGR